MEYKENEIIDISKSSYTDIISVYENSILYFKRKFENFDIDKFILEFSENTEFEIKFSYSYDNINWSNPLNRDDWKLNIENQNIGYEYIFLSMWFFKFEEDIHTAKKLQENINLENTNIPCVKIKSIKYDDKIIDIINEDIVNLVPYYSIINKLPKWNFYDNQALNIRRWLDTCISTTTSYGHTVIYFKTEPKETSHTFVNHVLRNVVSIKKMMVMLPGNELPQDRTVYTEWDMPMEGEFVIHVINEIFKNAFGETKIPLSKDYLYLPIINKIFRVSSVQPKNGFMGKIGWWEVFLTKYEDDETITISQELKDVYSGMGEDFNNALIDIDSFENDENNVIDELDNFLEDKVITKSSLQEKNIDEKKEANNNFSNRIVDSTTYLDLKETDIQKEFYSKRLQITSINPDENAFPVTMYDCTTVDKRVIALTYNLVDLTSVNKKSLLIDNFEFSFNFVLLSKFSGEIFDFNNHLDNSEFTLEFNRLYLSIIFHKYQKTFKFDYKFEINEFYQISLNYNESIKQLSVQIILLKNSQKNIIYQNIYIINSDSVVSNNFNKIELKSMYLYGGSFLTNELICKVNKNKIISDNVNPVLIMNQLGL